MTDPVKPIYAGEAQLVRWADSGAAGRTITLRIDEHTDVHPFKGLKYGDSGQRFEIAVVAKNDDEEPLDPEHAKKNASRHKARPKDGYTRSQMAAIKCNDYAFQRWLNDKFPDLWNEVIAEGEDDASQADFILKEALRISSKKELDSNPEKAAEWDRLIATFDVRDLVRR